MKKIVFETIGFFLSFILLTFIVGGLLVGCTSHIEAETETGTPLGYNRFQIVAGDYGCEAIIVDTETGVEYLWEHRGYAGGLTVLIDHNGKPLIANGYGDY